MSNKRNYVSMICDCGRKAVRVSINAPVCERCDRIEKEMDHRNEVWRQGIVGFRQVEERDGFNVRQWFNDRRPCRQEVQA